MNNDTIFALSSAAGQAGVAVIRVSGSETLTVYNALTGKENPKERYLQCNYILDKDKTQIDQAMTVYFKAPKSFTGEDVLEIHCHGSRAVIEKILSVLSEIKGCRMAERGEFTRRAVYHNKMDLTSAEGLIDLISSDTQQQRQWALRQMGGELQRLYDSWRQILVHNRAYLEAFIDFPEEEIPPQKMNEIEQEIQDLIFKIQKHLDDKNRGQALKNGFQIAIVGAPNVGKSSLLNYLSQKDAAIVSDTAGTTRDVVEVHMDIDGYPVVVSDTAGLHETAEEIEKEGIRRALVKAKEADLLLVLADAKNAPSLDEATKDMLKYENALLIWNKSDLVENKKAEGLFICAKTGQGVDVLQETISEKVKDKMSANDTPMITRVRYKVALNDCLNALKRFLKVQEIELKAEELRTASTALGKITGVVSTEELLDVIFSSFCIGK
ncbi:MAG: tRNA uridine-5-carboxymethylaminomethyl(34) synthesis GTPase MnmE [Alphaproteobacteria bacterium]